MVDVSVTSDVAAFMDSAGELLRSEPVLYSVILGVAQTRIERPESFSEPGTWACVRSSGRVVGAAMRTPPYGIFVTLLPPEAVESLAEAMASAAPDAPMVLGSEPDSGVFAAAFARLVGATVEVATRQRIYTLTSVDAPSGVPGRCRLAHPSERETMLTWLTAFEGETLSSPQSSDEIARNVDLRMEEKRLYVWDDGGPVSLVGRSNSEARVVKIAPVYTPPDLRGRGYASALTAAVSRQALDTDADLCCLYTDLANPTSNKIYQAVGYRPLRDSAMYRIVRE